MELEGIVLCPVCVDRQGLPDGSPCPRCGGQRDPVPAADPADVARARHDARGQQTRATLAALAGLLDQYGLAERFEGELAEIADAIHARHNEMADEL